MSDDPVPTPPPMDDDSFGTPVPPPMIDAGGLPVPGMGKLSEKDDRTFGMLAHLLGLFTGFVGPLVIWLIKKDESPFVDDQGKEALNFQICMTIGIVVSYFAMALFIGCLTLPALLIANLVLTIMATVKANEGVTYRYPVNIRLIK
ncbi:MAG: DUF4870 domain-containing protein [Verrucomicrobiales bacterium]|nr:DUF4870 domain-containing protein [Verrucomicrobiales bacterium]